MIKLKVLHIFLFIFIISTLSFKQTKFHFNSRLKSSRLHVTQQQRPTNNLFSNISINPFQSTEFVQSLFSFNTNIYEDIIMVREIKDENELILACKFCVQAFFGESKSIFHYFMTNKIFYNVKQLALERYYNRNPSKALDSFIVAEDNTSLVGFVQLSIVSVKENLDLFQYQPIYTPFDKFMTRTIYLPKITNLSVNPTYRNKGIGTKLLEEAITKAKDWGHEQVYLEVEDDNISAINLYKKLGFQMLCHHNVEVFDTSGIFLRRTFKPGMIMRKILVNDFNHAVLAE